MGKTLRQVIVARWKEDTEWVHSLPGDWTARVVQKSDRDTPGDLPNRGREPTSFLWYIIHSYLLIEPEDVFAFVQGNPFDHSPGFMDQLQKPVEGFTYIGERRLQALADGGPHHHNLPLAEKYTEWTGNEFPGSVEFCPGGQFMVTGKDILGHNLKWYESIYTATMDSEQDLPYVLERLWSSLF